jgi:hypothetical protein
VPYDDPETVKETAADYRLRLMAGWNTGLRAAGWGCLTLGIALILPGVADAVHLWFLFLFSALAGVALIGIRQPLQGIILLVCSALFYSILVLTIPTKESLDRRLVLRHRATRRPPLRRPRKRWKNVGPAFGSNPVAVLTPPAPVKQATVSAARPTGVPKAAAVSPSAEVRSAEIVQSGSPTQGLWCAAIRTGR